MPAAEGGSSEENADFKFDDQGTQEIQPEAEEKTVEQLAAEGDPAAYYRDLANKKRVEASEADHVPGSRHPVMRDGEDTVDYSSRLKQLENERAIKVSVILIESDKHVATARAIEQGDQGIINQLHTELLQDNIARGMEIDEMKSQIAALEAEQQGLIEEGEGAGEIIEAVSDSGFMDRKVDDGQRITDGKRYTEIGFSLDRLKKDHKVLADEHEQMEKVSSNLAEMLEAN